MKPTTHRITDEQIGDIATECTKMGIDALVDSQRRRLKEEEIGSVISRYAAFLIFTGTAYMGSLCGLNINQSKAIGERVRDYMVEEIGKEMEK